MLTSGEFAAFAGISERVARRVLARCHEGGTWRGHRLRVSVQLGGRGGASGRSYLVAEDSLPLDLNADAEAATLPVAAAPQVLPGATKAGPTDIPALVGAGGARGWRYELIKPALAHPKGSAARAQVLAELASRPVRLPDGSTKRIAERTLRHWLADCDAKGLKTFVKRSRSDKGVARVVISRAWDRAVPFDQPIREEIASEVRRKIRSLWAAGAPGWRHVARLASTDLLRRTLAAWPGAAPPELERLCAIPRSLVDAERKYKLLAIKDKDAKQFFDQLQPRARRSREGLLPMQVVVGDVHHLDILFSRPDGTHCTPKLIAWQDLATNRLFASVVILGPREGIRREHVILRRDDQGERSASIKMRMPLGGNGGRA